jgi:drug/metabolite transporter (DMT)-like permease
MNRSVLLRLLVLAAIWGGSFPLQRVAVPALGANVVGFGRLLLGAVALLILVRALGKHLDLRARWKDYLILGALNSALPFWLFAHAAPHLPSGYSAVLNATTPLSTVLVLWVLGAKPSASKVTGVAVGISGVALIAGFGTVALQGATLWAFLGGLLAAFCYAIAALETRRRFEGADAIVTAAGSLTLSTVLLAPLLAFDIGNMHPTTNAWLALLVIGLLCTGVAYWLYFGLLRDAGAERATTVTLLVPVFAMIWGTSFLGERVTLLDVAGAALVLFAVALVFEKVRWPWRRRDAATGVVTATNAPARVPAPGPTR